MKKLSIINENIFDGIGRRSKGGAVRKEDEVRQVDLGLPSGTIWAACNLGASSPEEHGDYYAWGETEPNGDYFWDGDYWYDYKFGNANNLDKYNKDDGKTILDPEDDAAHVVLGGKWHMPTKEQIEELFENTTNEHSELNGVKGILFTSNINDNTLFFPYSGYKSRGRVWSNNKYIYCWSSSLYTSKNYNCAYVLHSNFNGTIRFDYRNKGYSVRPVLDKK